MSKENQASQEDLCKDDQSSMLSEKIKASARQIWLAGLGAYNKAEEDTGRIFDKLVKEGEEIESLTRGVVEKQFKAVEDRVEDVKERVEDVKERATGTFGKLENVFDQRVSSALVRLGIPTKSHVAALEKRIAELEAKLAEKS